MPRRLTLLAHGLLAHVPAEPRNHHPKPAKCEELSGSESINSFLHDQALIGPMAGCTSWFHLRDRSAGLIKLGQEVLLDSLGHAGFNRFRNADLEVSCHMEPVSAAAFRHEQYDVMSCIPSLWNLAGRRDMLHSSLGTLGQ